MYKNIEGAGKVPERPIEWLMKNPPKGLMERQRMAERLYEEAARAERMAEFIRREELNTEGKLREMDFLLKASGEWLKEAKKVDPYFAEKKPKKKKRRAAK